MAAPNGGEPCSTDVDAASAGELGGGAHRYARGVTTAFAVTRVMVMTVGRGPAAKFKAGASAYERIGRSTQAIKHAWTAVEHTGGLFGQWERRASGPGTPRQRLTARCATRDTPAGHRPGTLRRATPRDMSTWAMIVKAVDGTGSTSARTVGGE